MKPGPVSPLLSIATITRNDSAALESTFRSIRTCRPRDDSYLSEWVVWDGGNESDSEIETYADKYLRGADSGIYDAMNKVAESCSGEFIMFLNGGDSLACGGLPELLHVLGSHRADVFLFAYRLAAAGVTLRRSPRNSGYLRYGLPTSHQAIVYRRSTLLSSGGYDKTYRVAGDYELTARLFKGNASFKAIDHVVAEFRVGGTSSRKPLTLLREAARIEQRVFHHGYVVVLHHSLRRFTSILTRILWSTGVRLLPRATSFSP